VNPAARKPRGLTTTKTVTIQAANDNQASTTPPCHSIIFRRCFNECMTDQLNGAIRIIRDLPEDEQDTIARQLMRLIDLAQSSSMELASPSAAGLS
jgi:hypothetical protein